MREVKSRWRKTFTRCAMCLAIVTASSASAVQTEPYGDLATPFESVARQTAGQPEHARIAAIRSRIDTILPGTYPEGAVTDTLIGKALAQLSAERERYNRVITIFPSALHMAIARFRTVFPNFRSPLPIYLYNSLGQRDGGSDYLQPGNRRIMFFGVDMIAKLHMDDSLIPFMEHELYHTLHSRSFADCDQLWCTLWKEGLAVDAAAVMTPKANDHQLLLDNPAPIRTTTDAHWKAALCFMAKHFDDTNQSALTTAFYVEGKPSERLPRRFGYYVGLRLVQETRLDLPQLTKLGNIAAKPVARAALDRLVHAAQAKCIS